MNKEDFQEIRGLPLKKLHHATYLAKKYAPSKIHNLGRVAQFLGPRGPLRTPLVSVPSRRPQQKFQTLSSRNLSFLFLQTLSSSNLSHSTQYTEH